MRLHLFCFYPMFFGHESIKPFPLNGTRGNLFQIAQSIHAKKPKVKASVKPVIHFLHLKYVDDNDSRAASMAYLAQN